jgi:hypothetical protein
MNVPNSLTDYLYLADFWKPCTLYAKLNFNPAFEMPKNIVENFVIGKLYPFLKLYFDEL